MHEFNFALPTFRRLAFTMLFISVHLVCAFGIQSQSRKVSGIIVDHKDQVLPGITVIVQTGSGERRTTTDEVGRFILDVPIEDVSLRIEGPYIRSQQQSLSSGTVVENLRIEVDYRIPPIHQSLVITASALEPQVETHSGEVYKKTLFSRD